MSFITPSNIQLWNSAYQPCMFGGDIDSLGYPYIFDFVSNVNGKAKFHTVPYPFAPFVPPGKYLQINLGPYFTALSGTHTIVSIDSNGFILTGTDYIAGHDDPGTGKILPNFIYRILHGYPDQTNKIDVKPLWNIQTNSLVVDLQEFLKSIFKIAPPVLGYDENMYTWFQVELLPAEDYAKFILNTTPSNDNIIFELSGYDHSDYLWWLVNGVIDNDRVNDDHTGLSDTLSFNDPITFLNGCIIYSKLINGRIFNVKTCLGDSLLTGIGYDAIEDNFIIA